MTAHRPPTLGTCPACGAAVEEKNVLIEYETGDGTAVYAECPDCTAVISPE